MVVFVIVRTTMVFLTSRAQCHIEIRGKCVAQRWLLTQFGSDSPLESRQSVTFSIPTLKVSTMRLSFSIAVIIIVVVVVMYTEPIVLGIRIIVSRRRRWAIVVPDPVSASVTLRRRGRNWRWNELFRELHPALVDFGR